MGKSKRPHPWSYEARFQKRTERNGSVMCDVTAWEPYSPSVEESLAAALQSSMREEWNGT